MLLWQPTGLVKAKQQTTSTMVNIPGMEGTLEPILDLTVVPESTALTAETIPDTPEPIPDPTVNLEPTLEPAVLLEPSLEAVLITEHIPKPVLELDLILKCHNCDSRISFGSLASSRGSRSSQC